MRFLGNGRAWLLMSSLLSASVVRADEEPDITEDVCEEITESPLPDDDHFFNFYQHDQRLDPNQFVKVVFGIMSKLKPDPIKKVQLDYNPILHHLVGPYKMRSTVSHETPRGIVVNCFDIVIQIHDTNECEYHGNSDWEHQCDSSTTCVNTEGGYYCACDEGKFAVKGSGNGKCDGQHDSTECCGVVTYDGAPHGDFMCRGDFKCHSDACAFNQCDANAECYEGEELNTYHCGCKDGYRDVSAAQGLPAGWKCEFVDHCSDDENACPIGCDCHSVTNADTDGFFCLPQEGYATYYPEADYEWVEKPTHNPLRLDKQAHMCVPLDAPDMSIAGPAPLILQQGDVYVEHGVTIVDESTANLQRRFETNYDEAADLMDLSGYVKACGTSVVTYTLRTPWLSGHEQVTATRIVEVVDRDECAYTGDDATFKHQCHFPAVCVNVACGTEGFAPNEPAYRCECTHKGFEPDGENGCQKKAKHRKEDGYDSDDEDDEDKTKTEALVAVDPTDLDGDGEPDVDGDDEDDEEQVDLDNDDDEPDVDGDEPNADGDDDEPDVDGDEPNADGDDDEPDVDGDEPNADGDDDEPDVDGDEPNADGDDPSIDEPDADGEGDEDQEGALARKSGLYNLFFGWMGEAPSAVPVEDSLTNGKDNADGTNAGDSDAETQVEEEEEEEPEEGIHDEDEYHAEFHDDHHCPERLSVAFSEIQWCIDEFTVETLSYYKRVIKKLYEKAYGHGDLVNQVGGIPPPYEWDKPYRLLAVDELRELAKERGLASPLGASVKNKDELLAMLATFDYDAFDSEFK